MKYFCSFLVVASGFTSPMLFAADSPLLNQSLKDARQQMERVREQVAAGLLASSKLADAQTALDDAMDGETLAQTLYGHVDIQDLTEAQSSEMTAAAQRRVDRSQGEVERGRALIAEGVAPKEYCADSEAELARRTQALDQAKDRAALLNEIVAMVHAEIETRAEIVTRAHGEKSTVPGVAEEFVDGSHGLLTSKDIKSLTLAFEKKFDKPLPVSARGETAVHRAMGFDHTGRIDVALMPDSTEGKWLRAYLETESIPYYAFRVAIPGKATGAHIHVGPGSTRLQSTD
jgi:hypothetical protein